MAKLPLRTDVLIVGAGPTGLTLGGLLRAAGVRTTIIDRSPRRSNEARASVLHSRGVEILDTLGAADDLVDEGCPIDAAAYYDMGALVTEVRFDTLDAVFPFALGIGQNRVEAALLDRLADLGCRVNRSTTIEQLSDEGDSVVATLRTAGDDLQEIIADWVVGCDGASSTVRSLIGASGPTPDHLDTYVLATLDTGGSLSDTTMHMFSAPDGFCVLSPLPGDTFRLTANIADSPANPSTQQLQALINSRGPRTDPLTISEPSYVARYKLRRGVADTMRVGRVLLAGDSAHCFSPVGGQGMNTGLHDAGNLAWKLAELFNGDAPMRLIETYDAERRHAARDAYDRTERLGEALSVSNPILRGARDLLGLVANVVPPLRQPLQRGLAGMDSVYSAGAYTAGAVSEGPELKGWGRPGERLAAVPRGLLADQRHHLVVIGHRVLTGDLERVATLAARHGGATVVHEIDPDATGSGATRSKLGIEPWPRDDLARRQIPEHTHIVLVRPDGHIGWTGPIDEAERLGAHMDRWLVRTPG